MCLIAKGLRKLWRQEFLTNNITLNIQNPLYATSNKRICNFDNALILLTFGFLPTIYTFFLPLMANADEKSLLMYMGESVRFKFTQTVLVYNRGE